MKKVVECESWQMGSKEMVEEQCHHDLKQVLHALYRLVQCSIPLNACTANRA